MLNLGALVRQFLLEGGELFIEDCSTRIRLQRRLGDSEPHTLLTVDEGVFVVTEVDERWQETVMLRTDAGEAVDRYFVRLAGEFLRETNGQMALVTTVHGALHPGIEISRENQGTIVRWKFEGPERWAVCTGREEAFQLAREIQESVTDLISSYRAVDGTPVYPQRRTP